MSAYASYIENANFYIKSLTCNINDMKQKMFEQLNLNENNLYISCDHWQNEDDIAIVKKILEISSRIVLLVRDQDNFHSIAQSHEKQVLFYNVSPLEYALSSDVHIFLYDTQLLQILYRFHKIFNATHPKDYPTENIDNIQALWGFEKLQFFFGEDAIQIQNFYDLIYYYFKDFIAKEEIKHIVQTFSQDRFLLLVKYMEKNRKLINRMFELSRLAFEYDILKGNFNCRSNKVENFIKEIQ